MKILPFSTHQNLKISEIRAKIKGKMLKTSNIKQKFRLRRAKSVKNNLNISISTKQKIAARRAAIFFTFSEKQKKNTGRHPLRLHVQPKWVGSSNPQFVQPKWVCNLSGYLALGIRPKPPFLVKNVFCKLSRNPNSHRLQTHHKRHHDTHNSMV